MGTNLFKKTLLLIGGLLFVEVAHAQYLRTSYFMEGTSSRLQLNPGLQPTIGYFNIPILGSFNMGASSNVLGTKDIIGVLDSGSDLFSNDALYNRLKEDNRLNVNLNTDLLSFGWYKGKGFWSVNVGLRAEVGASVPKNMFEYLRDANRFSLENRTLQGRISNMNFDVNAYAEVGLGYSRPVTDRLTLGGRVKVLLGIAHAEMQVDEFAVDMNIPQNPENPENWNNTYGGYTSAHAHITTSIKGGGLSFADTYDSYGNAIRQIDGFDFEGGGFGISGTGFGVDFGASYKLLDNLTLSAAVLDLGFINWKSSATTVASVDNDMQVDINQNNYQEYLSGDFLNLERFNLVEDKERASSYKTKLSSTVLVAGEYAFLNNKISVGAMYSAYFVQPKVLNELTLSATVRPKSWFNAAVSYSPVQAGGKSFGLALKLGPVFVGTDYMYFGGNSKAVNGFLGISIPLGGSKPSVDEI